MKNIPNRFRRLFNSFRKHKVPYRVSFIIIGIISTLWFLIRVVPKPSRAAYPCMRTAAPIMSSFIVWVLSLTGVFSSVKFIKSSISKRKYAYASIGVIALIVAVGMITKQSANKMLAKVAAKSIIHPANTPMGTGVGVVSGAVTWAWNPDATNEDCTNTFPAGNVDGADCFWMNKNNNQQVINNMVQQSIIHIGDNTSLSLAWESLFKNFNTRKGKGAVGYASGETVFVKINNGAAWSINGDFEYGSWVSECYSESAPQLIFSVVKQLIDEAGVPEDKIYVSDPIQKVYQDVYDLIKEEYPDVIIADKVIEAHGRVLLTKENSPAIFYSDNEVLGIEDETLYSELQNADYLINMSALKAHARAGLTISAKNHYGSHTRDDAAHLHPGLVAPENDVPERVNYGEYRTQVDLMGSKYLGKNTLLHVVDGLWGGTEGVSHPVKWQMSPFNGDWPSSVFMSQDQVAIESVCFDFLRGEVETAGSSSEWHNRPLMAQGVDDYMHQAADPSNWPDDVTYDPDGAGTSLTSLGTHEHWNNVDDKQYSNNLGGDSGILLIPLLSEKVIGGFHAYNTGATKPTFDGVADDALWQNVTWQYIDQFWMPYGEVLMPDDFSGRFKVMWSDTDNKLYVLAEMVDDVFVDGYVPTDAGAHNFDILEIFIDEDKSGGEHVGVTDFDNANAENAFSFHIAISRPDDGGTTTIKAAADIIGPGWGDDYANYADHMPDFIVKRDGNKLTWEFSIDVYNDQYDSSKDAAGNTASLINLTEGKTLGFAVAYCDNDTPGTDRDNFIGSDWGPNNSTEGFNDYWKLADNYATLTLNSSSAPSNRAPAFIYDSYMFSLSEKGTSVSVVKDLRAIAVDLDSDNLGFTSVSDNSMVLVSVVNYELIAKATDAFSSTAIVTVTADDGRGGVAQTEINITYSSNAPEFTEQIQDAEILHTGVDYTIVDDLNEICTGDNLVFTASSDDSNLSTPITGTKLVVNASSDFSGTAIVTVTAKDDSERVATTTFNVNYTPNGINSQLSDGNLLSIYPNPMRGETNIVLNNINSSESIQMTVYNLQGKVVFNNELHLSSSEFNYLLNLHNQPDGDYIVQVVNGNRKETLKIIKIK